MSEKRCDLRLYTPSREIALAVFDRIVDEFNYPPTLTVSLRHARHDPKPDGRWRRSDDSTIYYLRAWLPMTQIEQLGLEGKRVQDIYFSPPEAAEA